YAGHAADHRDVSRGDRLVSDPSAAQGRPTAQLAQLGLRPTETLRPAQRLPHQADRPLSRLLSSRFPPQGPRYRDAGESLARAPRLQYLSTTRAGVRA